MSAATDRMSAATESSSATNETGSTETSRMQPSGGDSVGRLQRLQPTLWLLAVGFFGIGDLVTTTVGLRLSGIVEAGPLVGPLIDRYGVGSLFALKSLALAASYGIWQLVPSPHRVGVPLGLAVLGIVVTGWNTVIVSTVLFS